METGLKLEKEFHPTSQDSAANVGSGALDVLSTPSVLAALENVAMNCVSSYLEPGDTTVGILANFQHIRASRTLDSFLASAELIEIDRRRLVFQIKATDLQGNVLAQGIHERFIVNIDKFMGKLS